MGQRDEMTGHFMSGHLQHVRFDNYAEFLRFAVKNASYKMSGQEIPFMVLPIILRIREGVLI